MITSQSNPVLSRTTIRTFNPSELPNLREIFRLNTPVYFDPEEEKDFESYLLNYPETYLVIESEDFIIGGGGYYISEQNNSGHITWTLIHPSVKGNGYGRSIVKACMEKISQHAGVNQIEVQTSQHSYHFFEKLGFELQLIKKDFWARGLDLYKMSQSIFHN